MDHLGGGLHWNGIQILVSVAEMGSFHAAARELRVSRNVIRTAIGRLEDQFGFHLFHRTPDGAFLTTEGRRIIASAREVEKSVTLLKRVVEGAAKEAATIRVAITEGLGTFWLTPRIVEFIDQRQSTDRVEVQGAIRNVDVLRLEADISVQLVEPDKPELIVRKLGYIHLAPFASPEYLARYGTPCSIGDLPGHRIVEQATDQLSGLRDALAKLFTPKIADKMIRLRSNLSSANYWAIVKGAGLGLLPNYAPLIGGRVVHVDIGINFSTPIWLAIHPEIAKSPRHREFIDMLIAAFDARCFPWFGKDFVAPAAIQASRHADGMEDYFRGFVASRLG